jgi:hypothetical protein
VERNIHLFIRTVIPINPPYSLSFFRLSVSN